MKRTPNSRLAALACLSALLFPVDGAAAGGRDWSAEPYPYTVVNQDVRGALAELGRNMDMSVTISDAVEGRVQGPWMSDTVGDFLQRIGEDQDLEWFFDGRRLHVSAAGESVTRMLPLKGIEAGNWQASLDRLGLANDRFPVTIDADQDIALVSGPPSYVDLIVQSLPKPKRAAVGRVNIIYGRNSRGDAS